MTQVALVTGATGYIGSHITRRLIRNEWVVHVIARPSSNFTLLGDVLEKLNVHFYTGTTDSMLNIIEKAKPDIVFHLASFAAIQYQYHEIHEMLQSNIIFSTDLVEAMVFHKVYKLINTSTFSQHYNNQLYNPNSLYAASKQAFEDILRFYLESSPLQSITLTLFDNYGPKDPRKKILNLLYASYISNRPLAMTPGEQVLDMVYIDDVVSAYLRSASRLSEGMAEKSGKYAVASRNPITLQKLVSLFEEEVGKKLLIEWGSIPYRTREIMVPWSDGTILPNWYPLIDLRMGLKLYLADKERT